MSVPIAMIAGVARNGVIGANGAIPWKIPSDMAYFKRMTMGKPMVMGRKQYESVGRPLPGRPNIVVTRQPGYLRDGIEVLPTLEAALDRGAVLALRDGAPEVMVIGGGEIYAQAMARAARLYISHIDLAPEGDVVFAAIDPEIWRVVEEPEVAPSERDTAAFRIRVYERR
jgi:dihydrofolate reductase